MMNSDCLEQKPYPVLVSQSTYTTFPTCCPSGISALTAPIAVFLTLLFVLLKKPRAHPYLQEPAGCVVLPLTQVDRHKSADNVDVSEKIHLVSASHHGPDQLHQARRALEVLAELCC